MFDTARRRHRDRAPWLGWTRAVSAQRFYKGQWVSGTTSTSVSTRPLVVRWNAEHHRSAALELRARRRTRAVRAGRLPAWSRAETTRLSRRCHL